MTGSTAVASDVGVCIEQDKEQGVGHHLSKRATQSSMVGVCCNPWHTFRALQHEVRGNGERFRMCGKAKANRLWPVIFGTSPWLPESSPLLLVLRSTLAAVFVGHWLWAILRWYQSGFWFIYLTNWSLTLETIYFCFAAFTTFQAYKQKGQPQQAVVGEPEDISLPWYVKVTFFLFHFAMPCSLMVCLLYWTLSNPVWALSTPPNYLNVFIHFINFLLCILDLLVGRFVFYLRYSTLFLVFVVSYGSWTGIHFAIGIGTGNDCSRYPMRECPIYDAIDWHHPIKSAIALGVIMFVVSPCCQLPLWWCVLKRRLIDNYLGLREVSPTAKEDEAVRVRDDIKGHTNRFAEV